MSDKLLAILAHSPYIGLFVLLILGGLGLPFPEDITLILCGVLIHQEVIEPLIAIPVIYAGLLISDMLIFSAGRKFGPMIVNHSWFRKILSQERLLSLENQFTRRGSLMILLGRQMLGIRVQLFLVAGVMKMSRLKFLIADAISSVFTITIMVGIGFIGSRSFQIITKDIKRIEHIMILALVAAVVIFVLYKSLKVYYKGNNQ